MMSEAGFVSLIVLLVVNIAAVAFSYGSLTQKVRDICRRIERLERLINGHREKRGAS